MATTKYTVFADEAERATRSSKTTAIKLADEIRTDEKAAVRVETQTGKVVYEAKAPKTRVIRVRTPKWTRVEAELPELGEGVTLPEGYTPAYARTRAKLAVLRNDEKRGDYLVLDLENGDTFEATNTKETAQIMRRIREERAQLAHA